MTQRSALRRWGEYLLAVLAGNILYFLVMPYLPAALQHQRYAVDLGLGVDFLFCVGCYALLRAVSARSADGTK